MHGGELIWPTSLHEWKKGCTLYLSDQITKVNKWYFINDPTPV